MYEEDTIVDDNGGLHFEESKKAASAQPLAGATSMAARGGTVVGEICNTEEMEQFEQIIEHRLEAYNNSSGVKNNSYGDDV